MCARIRIHDTMVKSCERLPVWLAHGRHGLLVWAGFAQRESVGWWQQNGGVLIDVPAHGFAQQSKTPGDLIWIPVPPGQVIRGIMDPREGVPFVKILIRPATESDHASFEHPRMPVLASPLFSADPIALAQA
jgi:hypothetical protein